MVEADLFAAWQLPERSAGVDEVGRGPLAGPVYAAAVVLPPGPVPRDLTDSKKLSARQRERLSRELKERVLGWSVASASVAEIDQLNILRASHLAMQRAVAGLALEPQLVLVDGNLLPRFSAPAVAVVGGDNRVPAIAAASIIAKVARDEEMAKLAERFPGYGLERHMGYATAAHLQALRKLGPSPVHRRSFAPVRDCLEPAASQTGTADLLGATGE